MRKNVEIFFFGKCIEKLDLEVFWGPEFIFDIYFDRFRHFDVILEQFSKNMKIYDL